MKTIEPETIWLKNSSGEYRKEKERKAQEESQIVRYRYGEANVKIDFPFMLSPRPLLPVHSQNFIGFLEVFQLGYPEQGP